MDNRYGSSSGYGGYSGSSSYGSSVTGARSGLPIANEMRGTEGVGGYLVKEKVPEGKTTCGLCSRLRRGSLYTYAREIGASKIALGHHREDIVETLFLNMFFGGTLKAMPPKLLSDDKQNVLIRPLAYCSEQEISRYAKLRDFPIIPCNLCGSQENLQRRNIKEMLKQWDREYPGRVESIFRSICHVAPSQLADPKLYPFSGLKALKEDSSRIDFVNVGLE